MSRITVIVRATAKAVALFHVALLRCETDQVTRDGSVTMEADYFTVSPCLAQDSVFSGAASLRICGKLQFRNPPRLTPRDPYLDRDTAIGSIVPIWAAYAEYGKIRGRNEKARPIAY
jgi:hypothetical protein